MLAILTGVIYLQLEDDANALINRSDMMHKLDHQYLRICDLVCKLNTIHLTLLLECFDTNHC